MQMLSCVLDIPLTLHPLTYMLCWIFLLPMDFNLNLWKGLCFFLFIHVVVSADVFQSPWDNGDKCAPPRGIEWLLYQRKPDYGWGENTHRANIALAVHGWKGTDDEEMTMMGLQLDDEIMKALMSPTPMHETDLALFIHALIATQRNPRDFHGIDLVADLLQRVDTQAEVNPFLVLALCNAHAVKFDHLQKIKDYTVHRNGNHAANAWELEMKALALKAMACAATLPDARSKNLDKFKSFMDDAVKCLLANQINGAFGNAYTTSLAVQALTAYNQTVDQKCLDYLKLESEINVNVVKKYYTEMALNAWRVKFIKELYNGPYEPSATSVPEYYTTYTIKDETEPDIYFSVIMKIPQGWNFFKVMEKASDMSDRFRFSYFMNKNKEPVVYKVIEKPNDAEANMFWRLCRQTNVRHDPHTSNITTYSASPALLVPEDKEQVLLWYRNTPCPSG